MKRRVRIAGSTVLLFMMILATGYAVSVAAEEVATTTTVVGPFNFQPLVDNPLDTLRKVEVPNLAIPIWLEGGR